MWTIRSGWVSLQFIYSMRKHVSYVWNSGELIQIEIEKLRNKRIFIYFPYCKIKLLEGAIFITDLTN